MGERQLGQSPFNKIKKERKLNNMARIKKMFVISKKNLEYIEEVKEKNNLKYKYLIDSKYI